MWDLARDKLDTCQFGELKNSSTVHAVVDLIHDWATATGVPGVAVRALPLDHRKAFDLIDRHVLIDKLESLNLPDFLHAWIAAFLQGRHQQVKVEEHLAEWLPMNGSAPQGTRVGPLAFLFMPPDLLEGAKRTRLVDDTLTWAVCRQSVEVNSTLQHKVDEVMAGTNVNRMQLNVSKTKEMLISFTRQATVVPNILMNREVMGRVITAKLLGVIISSDLSWSEHVNFITSKGSQKIYFLYLLRRAGASGDDILCLCKASVRAGLEYACAVWHTSLSIKQSGLIEHLQKRALRIIYPDASYDEALTLLRLETLHAHHERIARNFFDQVLSPEHRLHHLLPESRDVRYDLKLRVLTNSRDWEHGRPRILFFPMAWSIGSNHDNSVINCLDRRLCLWILSTLLCTVAWWKSFFST